MEPTPTLALPVSWLPTLTIMVPRKEAPLAADVEQAEVFARFFLRDDLGKVAAAQRLHTALEHTHHHGKHPELPLTLQEEGKDGNAGIGRDAHRDQGLGRVFLAQAAKDQRRRESHDLR